MLTKYPDDQNVISLENKLEFVVDALKNKKMNENESDIFVISRRFTEIQEFGFETKHLIESISIFENSIRKKK